MSSSNPEDPPADRFEARRSGRVSKDFLQADGDTWQENLAVCEAAGNKLLLRSYYVNKRSGKRVWDEPPSGASHIKPASDDMRRMANSQLQEMQLVFSSFPEEQEPEDTKKRGFFRRKKGKGGFFRKGNKGKAPAKETPDETMDHALQQAIALSMDLNAGNQEPVVRSEIAWQEEDEDLAMAKALSMSVSEPPMEEQEMLRHAIEQSKIESGVASMPAQQSGDLLELDSIPQSLEPAMFASSDDMLERKMPAAPLKTPDSPSGTRKEKSPRGGRKKPPPTSQIDEPSSPRGRQKAKSNSANPAVSTGDNRKAPPNMSSSLTTTATDTRKTPPANMSSSLPTTAADMRKPPPGATLVAPDSPVGITQTYSSVSGTYSSPSSPVAISPMTSSITGSAKPAELFDPYGKAAQSDVYNIQVTASADSNDSSAWTTDSDVDVGAGLQKMSRNDGRKKPGRSLRRRMSNQKTMKEKAGVV